MDRGYQYGKDVPFRFEFLSEEFFSSIDSFSCGEPEFNQLIRRDAYSKGTATYLFLNNDTNDIIAYFSIASSGIMTTNTIRDRQYTSIISAIEIKFFAVNQDYRNLPFEENSDSHTTLSAMIFKFFIDAMVGMTKQVIGAEKIILYAVPEALTIYQRCGFKRFETDMLENEDPFLEDCIPMYYTISTEAD